MREQAATTTAPVAPIPVPGRLSGDGLAARTWRLLERESLVVLCTAIFAIAFVLRLKGQVNQDAWLGLLSGREIADHGLPGHETWTIWGAGGSFVDQQWLAHLGLYAAYALGGFGALAGLHVVLTLGAIAAALAVARRRGASQRSVLLLLPLSFFCLILSTWQIRTQSFAYLLFVGCLWLAVSDARRPSPEIFLTLPLLAVWANLHGSVVLGAALVALRGLDRIAERRRGTGLALAALAPATLFVSPYAASLAGYYHHTLFNPAFSSMLNEWQPPRPGALTAPFFCLAIAVVWLAGRSRLALTRYERLAIFLTVAAALTATRNMGWFAFTALMLVPAAVEEAHPDRAETKPGLSRLNAAMAAATVGGLAVLLLVTVARPASWFTKLYPPEAAAAVAAAAAADPQARIYADVRYADWLLYEHPQLAGRIAFDARFELLSSRRIAQIYDFNDVYGASWPVATKGFRIVVLDRSVSRRPIRAILRRPGARTLYSGHGVAVLEVPA